MTEGQHSMAVLTDEAVGRNYLSEFCLLSAKQFQPEQMDRTDNFPCRDTVSHFPAM